MEPDPDEQEFPGEEELDWDEETANQFKGKRTNQIMFLDQLTNQILYKDHLTNPLYQVNIEELDWDY